MEETSEASISGKHKRRGKYRGNPLKYYREHYSHLTRGQLRKECRGLYDTLRRKKQLELVPLGTRKWKYSDNPIECYREHYSHLTRGQLRNEHKGLYHALRRKKQLELVPSGTRKWKYGDNPIEYYREHCSHLTRGQLPKKYGGLYHTLRRAGQLEDVLLLRYRENGSSENSSSLKTLLSEHTSDKSQKERNSSLEQILTT